MYKKYFKEEELKESNLEAMQKITYQIKNDRKLMKRFMSLVEDGALEEGYVLNDGEIWNIANLLLSKQY